MHNRLPSFDSYMNSGVYHISQSLNGSIKKAAKAQNLDFTQIDLRNTKSKITFLKTAGRALDFPSYFGMNWDAFSDLLTDMTWKPAAGYVILFTNFQSISENMAGEAHIVINILESSAAYWKRRSVPFFIIVSEKLSPAK
jgi:RNAse (barnase) inhibitor barstar